MDPSLLLKQSMEDYSEVMQSLGDYVEEMALGLNEPHHSQKRDRETRSEDGELDWRSASQAVPECWTFPWTESNNQLGINNGVVPNQTNVVTAQASQPTNISSSPLLKRNYSKLSETERAQKKKENDQAYRARCKKRKEDMQSDLETLTGENDSLKKENKSLKKDNALMHGTLTEQTKEIHRLSSDISQLKREHEKQNVLVQSLSKLLSDPVRLEHEKLKEENALLRKNANINNSLLAEENEKLKIENKVLKVQNDALCGKIISDNDKKREQKK